MNFEGCDVMINARTRGGLHSWMDLLIRKSSLVATDGYFEEHLRTTASKSFSHKTCLSDRYSHLKDI